MLHDLFYLIAILSIVHSSDIRLLVVPHSVGVFIGVYVVERSVLVDSSCSANILVDNMRDEVDFEAKDRLAIIQRLKRQRFLSTIRNDLQ